MDLLKKLLQKRETAGLLIGLTTLGVIFLPSPFFELSLFFLSSLFGYELALITRKSFLKYIVPLGFLFSLINLYAGILFSFLAALGYAYFILLKEGYYSFNTLSTVVMATLYGGISLTALVELHNINPYLVLVLVFATWANDTFAYYVGKNFGKRSFFRLISSKKTLEGFIGGLLAATFVGTFFSIFFGLPINIFQWLFVNFIAVFGDLFESFIKRSFGVKDSSNLLGSHGGFLDRFDALIFAALALLSLMFS
jgi:phosphatidate cytidylyltransferase